jgi:hypothetical protein
MNDDATEDFLGIIASQARQPEPEANNSIDSDTLAGGISPKSKATTTGQDFQQQQYMHSDYGIRLDQTAPRSAAPVRDETVQQAAIQVCFVLMFQSNFVLLE